jgi:membrane protein required for colicin V production
MEWYDIAMLVVLVGTTLFGFAKGMAWQIASLASLIVSYFAALRFSEPLVSTGLFGDEAPWNRFVAMLAVYLATSLAIWLVFRLVAGWIDRVKLQEFDRQIGGLIGFAKGVLLCVAITFFAVTVVPATRDDVLRSRSGHYIALLIARADAVMPPEVHDVLNPYLDRLEQELGEEIETATGAGDGEPATNTPRGTDSATSKHVSPIGFSTDKSADETAGEARLVDAPDGPAFPALRVPARRPDEP